MWRESSPSGGRSILITSAPRSARSSVQTGPAMTCVRWPSPIAPTETTMLSADRSLESGLPKLPDAAVWLIGAGNGDPGDLSPLAVQVLGTADAVIHDLE